MTALLLPAELAAGPLRLARPRLEDVTAVAEAVHETLDALAEWFRWGKLLARYGDLDDMGGRAVTGQMRFDELDRPVWFIWHGDRFVGELLIDNPDWDSHRALELQVWLRRSAWGQGLATIAAEAAIDHLFRIQGCTLIEARIGSANAPSRKLFTRLGFRAYGVRDDHNRYLLTAEDAGIAPEPLGVVVLSHPECLEHEVSAEHPEQPARIDAVLAALADLEVTHLGAPRDEDSPRRVHTEAYLREIEKRLPDEGTAPLDPDTDVSSASFQAALRGVGGAVSGIDLILAGRATAAFVVTRPPGHHALADRSMGFCLLGTCAIGAQHAVERRGLRRVAIVDFDVHHGNGTEALIGDDPRLMLWSLHEQDLFPMGVRDAGRTGTQTRRLPLPHRSDGAAMRARVQADLLPELDAFAPELILISAGFDAHVREPNSTLRWEADDYRWITAELAGRAPIVSCLEGGYDLVGIAEGARAHVQALIAATAPTR